MSAQIALQLYSIRDVIAASSYETAVRKIAEMGYRAVETAGFPGTSAEAAAKLFKDLGLTVVPAHTGLPVGDKKNEILDSLLAQGKPRLVCTQIGPNDVKTMDNIKALCQRLNQGYDVAQANGLSFGIHNHWWEFGVLDGKLVHETMLELLTPGIFFEIDTYWVKVAGIDPATIVANLGARVPLLHIKDGPANTEAAMTAVGDGVMDVKSILKAAGENAKALVVELDKCDTDIMVAVKKSFDYLSSL
jgi:sugar phosphate isomerase/epimerase